MPQSEGKHWNKGVSHIARWTATHNIVVWRWMKTEASFWTTEDCCPSLDKPVAFIFEVPMYSVSPVWTGDLSSLWTLYLAQRDNSLRIWHPSYLCEWVRSLPEVNDREIPMYSWHNWFQKRNEKHEGLVVYWPRRWTLSSICSHSFFISCKLWSLCLINRLLPAQ